jgi:hypothetical protein
MADVKSTVAVATPVVKKLATDENFRKTVVGAYIAAKSIYDEVGEDKKVKALAGKLATDPKLQKELSKQLKGVQKSAKKATKKSHKKRNALILAGITVGLLYNPATGPDTRRWIKEKISGSDDTFDYELDAGNGASVPPAAPAAPPEEPQTQA